jgi:L-fucose isomerase-like protein
MVGAAGLVFYTALNKKEDEAMGYGAEKLLLFGGVPSEYLAEWDITDDLSLAGSRVGVTFDTVSQDALLARYESLTEEERREAIGLARDLAEGASPVQYGEMPPAPTPEEMEKATALYIAMRHFAETRQADAVTVACGPWIRGEALPVPCVALMLFQEQGMPAACQGDIDALLTMVLFKRAAGLASFMGGAINAEEHLGINHCVICRNLPAPGTELAPYVISTYHGRKDSPTLWADIPTGETVTIGRLTKNLDRLLLLSGTLVGNKIDSRGCRNTLVIDVPDPNRVLDAVKGIQNHYVVAYGDHAEALAEMAAAYGIDVVRLDR